MSIYRDQIEEMMQECSKFLENYILEYRECVEGRPACCKTHGKETSCALTSGATLAITFAAFVAKVFTPPAEIASECMAHRNTSHLYLGLHFCPFLFNFCHPGAKKSLGMLKFHNVINLSVVRNFL